jgi:fission process protein 1
LAVVPALPYIFDKPVEHAVEWTFYKGFELIGGPEAVKGRKPAMGFAEEAKEKVKEL